MRKSRLYLPGCAFHICSRTQGHQPWFTDDIKDDVAEILLHSAASAGARVVAFAVMDNHFHLVLFQGRATLGWTLQPALRRIALRVQKRHSTEGHVFERRFRAKACKDEEYLPNAIVYVHRNPVKARICSHAGEYRWSSAHYYERSGTTHLVSVEDGLRAFAPEPNSIDHAREVYLERLNRSREADLDTYWEWFWHAARRNQSRTGDVSGAAHRERAALADIRDTAVTLLRAINPDVEMDLIRSRYGSREVTAVRHQLIAALSQRGYSGVQVSCYLRVSQTMVSRIRSALRWSSIRDMTV